MGVTAETETTLFLKSDDRVVMIDHSNDSAVVLFLKGDLALPEVPITLTPVGEPCSIGADRRLILSGLQPPHRLHLAINTDSYLHSRYKFSVVLANNFLTRDCHLAGDINFSAGLSALSIGIFAHL